MKRVGLVLFLLSILGVRNGEASPPTAQNVDIKSYMGRWYEVARLPNSFEDECVGDVTAEYSFHEDGDIRVTNSCRLSNGTYDVAEGLAWLPDPHENSKLKVSFVPFLKNFYLFGGDYWIFAVDEAQYALVGSPDFKFLWILSREPILDVDLVHRLIEEAKSLGFRTRDIIYTLHG